MLENIIITSGGTSEPIDRIRSITNTSTGKLGSLIAEEFAKKDGVKNIYYIHAKNAVIPDCEKLIPIPITSTADLLAAVEGLSSSIKADAVIHCMAVSDFRVRAVISADTLEQSAERGRLDCGKLFERENLLKKYNKLPSSDSDPVILLEKTPKILSRLRELFGDAVIVGFKLLDGVSHEELTDTAYRLLIKNRCDYVLANDYTTVEAGEHQGYLVDKDKRELHFSGKQSIARGIAEKLTGGND